MPTLKGREESGKGYDKDSPRGHQHSTAPRVLRALCKGKSEKKDAKPRAHIPTHRHCISRRKPYGIQAVMLCGLLRYNQGGIWWGTPMTEEAATSRKEGICGELLQPALNVTAMPKLPPTVKSFKGNTA